MRGIEARRQDTAPFIARTQLEMIELLGQAGNDGRLEDCLPELAALLRRRLRQMNGLNLPLEDFLVTLRVSRNLDEFRVASPAALATAQLAAIGKEIAPRAARAPAVDTRRAGRACLGPARHPPALRARPGALPHPAAAGCRHGAAAAGHPGGNAGIVHRKPGAPGGSARYAPGHGDRRLIILDFSLQDLPFLFIGNESSLESIHLHLAQVSL